MVSSGFVRRLTALLVLAGLAIGVPGPAGAATKAERCQLQRATITGTNGDDVIKGTPGKDVVVWPRQGTMSSTLAASQTWSAGEAVQTESAAGAGRDALTGGRGDDTLRGGRNDDSLLGDVMKISAPGSSPVRAGGDDHLIGGRGTDGLTGDNFSNTSNLRGAGDDLLEDSSKFSTYMTGDNLASRVKVSGRGDDVLIDRTGPGELRARRRSRQRHGLGNLARERPDSIR